MSREKRPFSIELVGRAKELSTLADAIRSARQHCVCVIIQGEAGIGKSVLLARCASEAQSGGFTHLHATAHLDGAASAFSPLTDLLTQFNGASHQNKLSQLLGSSSTLAPPSILALAADARSGVMEGFTEALAGEAAKGPVILTVEDLHWAEPSTPLALRSMRRRLHDLPILIVASTRPVADSEIADAIQALEDATDRVIDLGPLSSEQSQTLAERLIGVSGLDSHMWPRCNPLVIHQWAYDVLGGRSNANDPPGEDPIRTSTQGRLSQLSSSAVAVARTLAVFGRAITLHELRDLCSLGNSVVEDVQSCVDKLNESGLTRTDDNTVEFKHDLLRGAVLIDCPPSQSAELHQQAAAFHTDRQASPGVIASHLAQQLRLGTPETPNEARLRQGWLIRAAESASGAAPGLAARLLEEALVPFDPSAIEWREHFIHLTGLYGSCGRLADSERIATKLLETNLEPSQDLMVRWWLASVLFASGRLADGREVAEAGLAAAVDPLSKARLSAITGLIALLQVDSGFRDALERADRANALVDDPSSKTIVEAVRTWSCLMNLDVPGALAAAEEAVRIADSDPSGLAHRYQPVLFQAFALLDSDDQKGLERILGIGRRRALQTGTAWAESLYLAVDALRALRNGQFDDALAHARASLAVIDETGVWVGAVLSHSVLAQVFLVRGDLDATRGALSEARFAQGNDRLQFGADLLVAAEGELSSIEDSMEVGLTSIVEAAEFLVSLGFRTASFEVLQPVFRLLLNFGPNDRKKWLDRIDELTAHPTEAAILIPLRAWLQALRVGTAEAWNDAIVAVDRQGWKWRMAVVRLGASIDAYRVNDDEQAAFWRHQTAERLQAMTASAALAMLLAQAGGRTTDRLSNSTLSKTERNVARSIAEGLSNREIADLSGQSIRTVESHVSAVLRKLDATSRAKVAARFRP